MRRREKKGKESMKENQKGMKKGEGKLKGENYFKNDRKKQK